MEQQVDDDGLPQEEEASSQQQRREMRVCDAGGFLALMNLLLDDDDDNTFIDDIRRAVPSREVLQKIADASSLVRLLQNTLLPSLRRHPAAAAAHLLLMEACAHKLKVCARAVGGSFAVSCAEFARRISSYAADARGHPGDTAADEGVSLRGSVDDLLCQAGRFLDMTVTPTDCDEAEADEIEDHSPCQRLGDHDEDSQDGQISGPSTPSLPEDIWRHIHSLMPMDAAARAACLSHAFLSSWRCYPKLILCSKKFMAASGSLRRRIDKILKNHSGIGLKILRLNLLDESSCFPYIDGWLKVAVTPGIEELNLRLHKEHNFPCSVLSTGVGNSIRSLQLDSCVFHPTAELGPLRSLTSLRLCSVCITGGELECLLSNSLALERLELTDCNEIVSLKIPPVLQQLRYLRVGGCYAMQIIENKAPSIASFTLSRGFPKLELGEASKMIKVLQLNFGNSVRYARAVLPSMMPNLETIYLGSTHEVNTPMLPSKFVNLKHLSIQIASSTLPPSYDYSSLLSFLVASPSLETWWLQVPRADMGHELVGSSHLRQLPERRHDRLKIMEIEGFNCTKSLVELTCCIVKSAVSLECLTLYTLRYGKSPCCWDGFCMSYGKSEVEEASTAAAAVRRYIEDKVAPTTKLTVMEPCPRCIATAVDNGLAVDDGLALAE